MKKHIFIISVIIFLSLGFITLNLTKINAHEAISHQQPEQEYYILKNHNGRIALFSSKSEIPIKIYDIYAKSLPEKDTQALNEGIKAESEAELNNLIETYLS